MRQLADALLGKAVDRDQVMVPGDAHPRERCEQLDALVRMRTVAHDISSAHILVDGFASQQLQAGAQRRKVRVDVGQQPVTHG